MRVMDIQVVDKASKPDLPVATKINLILAARFIPGLLISFGYAYVCYRKLQP